MVPWAAQLTASGAAAQLWDLIGFTGPGTHLCWGLLTLTGTSTKGQATVSKEAVVTTPEGCTAPVTRKCPEKGEECPICPLCWSTPG